MTRNRALGILALLVWTLLAVAPAAWAQSTGSLAGVVSDASGAALPGVTVTVTSQSTGLSRTITSGHDGFYSAPLLPPGVYRITARLACPPGRP